MFRPQHVTDSDFDFFTENSSSNNTVSIRVSTCYTKLPAGLDESELWVVNEEGDGPPQEVGLGLEVSVEDGHEVAVLDVAVLHALLEGAGLVAVPVAPDLVLYVDAFARPSLALQFHQVLQKKIINWTKTQRSSHQSRFIYF